MAAFVGYLRPQQCETEAKKDRIIVVVSKVISDLVSSPSRLCLLGVQWWSAPVVKDGIRV